MRKQTLEETVNRVIKNENSLNEGFWEDFKNDRELRRMLSGGNLGVGALMALSGNPVGSVVVAVAAIYLGSSYSAQAIKALGRPLFDSLKVIAMNVDNGNLSPKLSKAIKDQAKELENQ